MGKYHTSFWRFAASLFFIISCQRSGQHSIIQNKGSDTLVNLAQMWAEEYSKVEPTVALAVSGGGSGTGIAALINGTVDIANSSRRIKDQEKLDAEKFHQAAVQEHIVGYDALAVFVHPNNPLDGMTIEEIGCIYGKRGKCNYWSDIRGTVVPGCKDNQIIRISRQSNSGTYQYFRDAILGTKQDFRLGSMDLNGSREGIDMVAQTPCSIGYTGMGYLSKHVKTICIAKDSQAQCIAPTPSNALDRSYPIARELFMYTVGPLKSDLKKFFDWIKTDAAKKLTIQSGFVPVP